MWDAPVRGARAKHLLRTGPDHDSNTKPGQMRAMVIALRAPRRLLIAICIGVLSLGPGIVRAQSVDCDALRQEMAAVTRPDPNREARFARAIEQQRSELARTQAYADQIGCGGFNLFGGAPPQCDAIANRVSRMENNLDSLDAQARALRNGNPDRAQDLAARYDSYCRTTPGPDSTEVYSDPGLMPDDGTSRMIDDQPAEERPQGGNKAICVRTCDGGFFPLGSSVHNGDLDGLQTLCSAQCPNTEAKLYTTSDTDNIADAIALDGTSYTALPAAFKFQKTYDAACTCKPPNQSWVQALAKAEELLDKSRGHDVTVTEKMSADMSRPTAPASTPVKKGSKAIRKIVLDQPPPTAMDETALGSLGAQAPTASTASAGIAAGVGAQVPVIPATEGAVKTFKAPDGTSRRVRIIAPAP